MANARQALGAAGEAAAAAKYEYLGYRVVARNWRCVDGEIDLVVQRRDELVICEVKTRSSDRFGTPAEAITRHKLARLRRLAARYARESQWRGTSLRLDVAAVTPQPGNTFAVEIIEGVG